MYRTLISIVFFSLTVTYTHTQEKKSGPIIKEFGNVYTIENPDLILEKDKTYKVIFDVYSDAGNHVKVNPLINTVARFLNMHGQQGVPLKNLNIVLVLHGTAAKNVIEEEGNPNIELLKVLKKINVQTYVCGQSLLARGLDRSKVTNDVKVALSAMTALVKFQNEGYHIINFN